VSTTKSKKAGFFKSFGTFFLGIGAFLAFRWLLFEPYVIPSGSMIPSLLIYDHILVSKLAYGVRLPFSQKYIYGPLQPERGDVVIFQSVEEDIVMIKRVIGLPGDTIEISDEGTLTIQGRVVERKSITPEELEKLYPVKLDCLDCDEFYQEYLSGKAHPIQLSQGGYRSEGKYTVPEGHLFVLGDNRDRSRDSRYWGMLPVSNLLGKARWVWLSCSKAASKTPVLCHPAHIRWQRIFSKIQ
jgi:signal peptidase I